MTAFKEIAKMTKKERKAYYATKRGSWYGINPVTRTVPNRKAYNRARANRAMAAEI